MHAAPPERLTDGGLLPAETCIHQAIWLSPPLRRAWRERRARRSVRSAQLSEEGNQRGKHRELMTNSCISRCDCQSGSPSPSLAPLDPRRTSSAASILTRPQYRHPAQS